MLNLIELSPFELVFDGQRSFIFQTEKSVVVDGEKYYKTVSEHVTRNYNELYSSGEMKSITVKCFKPILGSDIKIWYYHDYDFSEYVRHSIQSFYGNVLMSICKFYGFNANWGKAGVYYNEYYIKSNNIPIEVYSAYGCSLDIYLPYQKIVELDLFEYTKYVLDHFGVYQSVKNLFLPLPKNEFAKTDRLIQFNDVRFGLFEYEEDLL